MLLLSLLIGTSDWIDTEEVTQIALLLLKLGTESVHSRLDPMPPRLSVRCQFVDLPDETLHVDRRDVVLEVSQSERLLKSGMLGGVPQRHTWAPHEGAGDEIVETARHQDIHPAQRIDDIVELVHAHHGDFTSSAPAFHPTEYLVDDRLVPTIADQEPDAPAAGDETTDKVDHLRDVEACAATADALRDCPPAYPMTPSANSCVAGPDGVAGILGPGSLQARSAYTGSPLTATPRSAAARFDYSSRYDL